jgi:hypothetical protein
MQKRKWTKEIIIDQILELHSNGVPLSHTDIRKSHPRLCYASYKYFKTWKLAIKATGLKYSEIRRRFRNRKKGKWNKELVIKEIIKLNEEGVSLRPTNIKKIRYDLLNAAIKFWGSWRVSVSQSGIDYSKICPINRCFTKEEIIEKILELHRQGEKLNDNHVRHNQRRLYDSARKRFKSWEFAITCAGLDYLEIRAVGKSLTKDEIIEKILELHKEESVLNSYYVRQHQRKLYTSALHRFTSWQAAVEHAKLDYNTIKLIASTIGTPTRGKDNAMYDSMGEAAVADKLFDLLNNGLIKEYVAHQKVSPERAWSCDFVVTSIDDVKIWIEFDGMLHTRKNPYLSGTNKKINHYIQNNFIFASVLNCNDLDYLI